MWVTFDTKTDFSLLCAKKWVFFFYWSNKFYSFKIPGSGSISQFLLSNLETHVLLTSVSALTWRFLVTNHIYWQWSHLLMASLCRWTIPSLFPGIDNFLFLKAQLYIQNKVIFQVFAAGGISVYISMFFHYT